MPSTFAVDDYKAIAERARQLRPERIAMPEMPPECECRLIFDDGEGGCYRVWTRGCPVHG